MVTHTAVCSHCGETFAYDAPPTPAVTPDFCSEACARSWVWAGYGKEVDQ